MRAHDVPFMIEHGQRVCKLTFERMLDAPETLVREGIGSNYQRQSTTLGKHFKPPEEPIDRKRGRSGAGGENQLDLLDAGDERRPAAHRG